MGKLSQSQFDDTFISTKRLHAARCALLGPDELFNVLQETEEYQHVLTSRFKSSFGVEIHGWRMVDIPMKTTQEAEQGDGF